MTVCVHLGRPSLDALRERRDDGWKGASSLKRPSCRPEALALLAPLLALTRQAHWPASSHGIRLVGQGLGQRRQRPRRRYRGWQLPQGARGATGLSLDCSPASLGGWDRLLKLEVSHALPLSRSTGSSSRSSSSAYAASSRVVCPSRGAALTLPGAARLTTSARQPVRRARPAVYGNRR